MAQLLMDLSGRLGLTNKYYGDIDSSPIVSGADFPHRKIIKNGEMASGIFNPFWRDGYLSPGVSSKQTLTGASAEVVGSIIYDQINNHVYYGARGRTIKRASMSGSALNTILDLGTSGTPIIHDLEIYQRNAVRTLYVVYEKSDNLHVGISSLPMMTDTFTAAVTDIISWATTSSGGLANGDRVMVSSTTTLPAGLSANTVYFIVEKSGFTGKLSLTSGGAAVDITDTGTGTHTLTTFLNTWLTTLTSGAFTNSTTSTYNFMRLGDNGAAYIFADNTIHRVNGTSTGGEYCTVTPNAIKLPTHFRFHDAIDYRGKIIAAVHQSSFDMLDVDTANVRGVTTPSGIYIWDRLSTESNMTDYLPIEGILAIRKIYVAPDGSVRIITTSANKLSHIRTFNGTSFPMIKELGRGAAPVFADSLSVGGNLVWFVGKEGDLYAHGGLEPGGNEVLTKVAKVFTNLTGSGLESVIGAIIYGSGISGNTDDQYDLTTQAITLCGNDGGAVSVYRVFPFRIATDAVTQNAAQGDIYTGVHPLPFSSTVKDIVVYCLNGTATGVTVQATLKIYFNGSSTAWASKTVTRDDINKGYKVIPVNMPFINSIQIEIEYPTDIIFSDTYDFHPSYAVVDYQPSTAKK